MWTRIEGKDSDVALNSRVALARNLEDYPFSDKMTPEQAKSLIDTLKTVYREEDGWSMTDLAAASPEDKRALAEQRVIPQRLAASAAPAAIFQKDDVTVTAGGEDHVRIEAVLPGNDLAAAMEKAFAAEALLDEHSSIAFTERFGYVTRNPEKMGTAMNAAVTLHLPVATDAGWIARVAFRLAKEGIAIRSMDGNDLRTALYLVTNRETSGQTEEEIAGAVQKAADGLLAKERELREKLGDERRESIAENVRRTYGMLLYADRVGASELVSLYSRMRLAAAMKLVDMPVTLADEAMFACLPHTLAAAEKKDAEADLGRERAARLKEILRQAPLYQKA